MLKHLFSFRDVNWWVLLAGLGLSFVSVTALATFGTYLSETSPEFYQQWGMVLMVLGVFLLCLLTGFITGKTAGDLQLRHAFLSSMGAAVPLLLVGVLTLNPMLLLMVAVAVAGAMNGGSLAVPKRRYGPPRNRE
ncbi:MAG: hypothetical protein GX552_06670 [Chloroflexi bacterium]|jgi:hypothetical protein|nr:hypothetical protein [Chloroflexota bacterium]